MASLESLTDLLQDELKDIYDAEKQLTKALPKLAKNATSDELRQAFEEHLQQTKQHIERLEEVFEHLELPARGKPCEGMKGLIREGQEMMQEAEDDATRDALMIGQASHEHRREHRQSGSGARRGGRRGDARARSIGAGAVEHGSRRAAGRGRSPTPISEHGRAETAENRTLSAVFAVC
jgi:hypothetical protein